MSTKPKYEISPKLIDRHTQNCDDCENRRKLMKFLYEQRIPVDRFEEMEARDRLLDEQYAKCCVCFKKEFNLY